MKYEPTSFRQFLALVKEDYVAHRRDWTLPGFRAVAVYRFGGWRMGIKPKLLFRGFAVAGCEPDEMGIGPVYAIPKLLKRHGLKVDDIDLWELNEAFAVQVIYCRDKLGIDQEKLNINGGSVAIGHPFGMTGSRMVGTLANQMIDNPKARYGVITMCIGGGQGAAGLFESCS